jgi:hypothetical protein
MNLNPLWVVEPFKDAGNGNTPPVVKLEPGGPSFAGPPSGIAGTLTTKISDPLSLTLWIHDDQPLSESRLGYTNWRGELEFVSRSGKCDV